MKTKYHENGKGNIKTIFSLQSKVMMLELQILSLLNIWVYSILHNVGGINRYLITSQKYNEIHQHFAKSTIGLLRKKEEELYICTHFKVQSH